MFGKRAENCIDIPRGQPFIQNCAVIVIVLWQRNFNGAESAMKRYSSISPAKMLRGWAHR